MKTVPVTLTTIALLLIGCGGTGTRTSKNLIDSDFQGRKFSNFLVIAVAGEYDARAQFERTVVARIRATGADATAYYSVIGHNPRVTVNDVTNAVRARRFDAVLFTRVKGSTHQVEVRESTADGQAVTIGGNVFDLFRYDYEEYKEPDNVRISTDVVLLTELYDAAAQRKIWAVESSSFDRESVELIVDGVAKSVAKALGRDNLIGRR